MNRISIVQSIIKKMKAKNYLEIGVSLGHTFLTIDAKRKIGVDPQNLLRKHSFSMRGDDWMLEAKKAYRSLRKWFKREDSRFFELTSDDFFQRIPHIFSEHKIDVALIDGLHSYEQALKDILNCLKYLNSGGVVVLHDCNPANEAMAIRADSVAEAAAMKVPGWDYLWCGDVWKAMVYLRSFFDDLNVFVLDCDMGIGIVTRGKPENKLAYSGGQIERLTYSDLVAHRASFLNLKPPAYFTEFLNQLPTRLESNRS